MENQPQQVEPPAGWNRKWYQKITVEPSMTLYMFAFMLTSVVEQAFFIRKACLVNHNYPEEICNSINSKIHDDIKKEIQVTVSDFHQWNNISAHVFPIVLALFLGSWSDKRGRKFPLLMGLIGKFIYSVMIVVNDQQPTWPVEYIIYTATIPCALSGADVAIFMSCFSYISDVSTVENRTIRVTILDICYLATMPTGVAIGSYLFNHVLNFSYTWMFTINSCLIFAAIVYSFLALEWQTTAKQRPLRELGCCGFWGDFFDVRHVAESVRVLFKKREHHRRLYLAIFMIGMAFYTFQRDEKPFLYLYTQLKWEWNVEIYSNFKTFQSSAYVLAMLLLIPLLSKLLKWRDTSIVLLGTVGHATARLIYYFAPLPWTFYIGSAFCSIGPIVGPVLRSMTSKTVPMSERGKIFAFLSVCDNAVPFISSVLYNQVYKATLGQEHSAIFLLTFATQVLVFCIILIVHITLGSRELAVPELDKNEVLLNTDNQKPTLSKTTSSSSSSFNEVLGPQGTTATLWKT